MIAEIMKDNHISMAEVGRRTGYILQSVNQYLKREGNMRVNTFIKFIEAIGYDVQYKYIGCAGVVPEYLEKIIETKRPLGVFYCMDEKTGMLKLVDNRAGRADVIMFPDKDTMIQWADLVKANDPMENFGVI